MPGRQRQRRSDGTRRRLAFNCVEYVLHHPIQPDAHRSRCKDCGAILIKADGRTPRYPNWVTLLTVKEWP